MNILVYNLAAEYAGALTVLKDFYNEVITFNNKSHKWFFAVSTDVLKEYDNIKVIRVPWIKKSWLHRWYYDKFCARRLEKKYNIDLVFSMQNMSIDGVKCPQIVYLHQSLQFSPVKFSLFKKEERMYWIRQNIICNLMKKSLQGADSIIVQTNWMKEATQNWLNNSKKNIKVLSPKIEINICDDKAHVREMDLFFYPAGDGVHKNHKLILQACEILKEAKISYRVLFTMDPNESSLAKSLYSEVIHKGLNIEFTGLLSREMIMQLYKRATLIFPSYLETFGLPLLEGRKSDDIILCSDLPFAHEILEGYKNAYFFGTDDAKLLAEYMKKCSCNMIEPIECSKDNIDENINDDDSLIKCILEENHYRKL